MRVIPISLKQANDFVESNHRHHGKIARAMGYQKIITYTLADETGISLKAAGWICKGICGGGNWNVKGRPRTDSRVPGKKKQYYKLLQGG